MVGLSKIPNEALKDLTDTGDELIKSLGYDNLATNLAIPGNKNIIINGNFDIWQRDVNQSSSGYGSDDRWSNDNIGSGKTSSQEAFIVGQTDVPNNPKYYSRTVVSSVANASNYCLKQQKIEGVDKLSGETITVSFWAKSNTVTNMAIDFIQHFGTGGVPSANLSGIGSTTINLTTTWQKFTATISITSISGKTIGSDNNDYLALRFWFDAGSDFNAGSNTLGQQSGTFDIAQVQIERGDSATDFEERLIGHELSLCYRYYYDSLNYILGSNYSGTNSYLYWQFPVQMRGIPTIVETLTHTGTLSSIYNDNGLFYGRYITGDSTVNGSITADAEL